MGCFHVTLASGTSSGSRELKVQPFYDALSTLLATNKYLPSWTKQCTIGDVQYKKVLQEKGEKRTEALQAKQPLGEWVTPTKAIKANGEALKPLVILKGKTMSASCGHHVGLPSLRNQQR